MAEKTAMKDSTIDVAASRFHSLLFPEGTKDAVEDAPQVEAEQAEAPEGDEPAAQDEPTSDEPTDTADEPADDEPAADPQPKRSRKLKIDNEEVEVDEDEAYAGYLRQSDYTRKTQAAAKLKQEAEAERAESRRIREQYSEQLNYVKQNIDQLVPQEPNWADLKTKVTPEQYTQMHTEWTQVQKLREKVIEEQEKIAKEQLDEFQKAHDEMVQKETEKLWEMIPEWKDPTKFNAATKELVSWLRDSGYGDEQIGAITDHRLIAKLHNAMKYEKAAAGAPKPTVQPRGKGSKTIAPGSAPAASKPAAEKEKARDLKRLKETGKIGDAGAAFMHFV
jgi:hypothetical protein